MLQSIAELEGYRLLARDGEFGKLKDVYFDDNSFTAAYVVVDTGTWLPGRKVLIPLVALDSPDWGAKVLPVELTKKQIENCPPIAVHKPVSRQEEIKLFEHLNVEPYWVGGLAAGGYPVPPKEAYEDEEGKKEADIETAGDPHLRSFNEIKGYHVQATDGDIGHIDDMYFDDEDWVIRYAVVDTRNWLPGRKVIIASDWIDRINWVESRVHVDLTRHSVKNSPEFDDSSAITRTYEDILWDHYKRQKYWL
jgi:hypothetical protein